MGLLGLFPQKSSSSIDDLYNRSGKRVYRAAFTVDFDENDVRKNLGPTFFINYPHPSDAGQVITGIDVDQDDSGITTYQNQFGSFDINNGTGCYWWDVSITYGGWNPLEHSFSGNPIDQPVTFSFQWVTYEQAVDVAITGKNSDGSYIYSPVVNSANIPFDPPVVKDQLRGSIRISQNVMKFDIRTFFAYGNTINNDLWNGFAINTIKLSPPNMPERLYSQFLGQTYYRLDYEFNFNPDGWNARPIDRGYSQLITGGRQQIITDLMGTPLSTPTLLDGAGRPLLNPTPATIHSFNFQVYSDLNFSETFPKFNQLFV